MADVESRLIYLVDDDQDLRNLLGRVLRKDGHEVELFSHAEALVDAVRIRKPDLIITDLMMPGIDGMGLLQQIRDVRAYDDVRVIVVSAKSWESDREAALQAGADAYLIKPFDHATLRKMVDTIVRNGATLTYWGVHGTLPVPGPRTTRYGGNTSCASLELADGRIIVFDAGSGIRNLGNSLMGRQSLVAALLISHPHWDHLNSVPFFAPLYVPGNQISIYGAPQRDQTLRQLIEAQMDGVFFPITPGRFGSSVHYVDIREESFELFGVQVHTMHLSHPGACLGFKVVLGDKSYCYITDNELFLPGDTRADPHYMDQLTDFVRGAEILTTDTTYFDEEYPKFVTWGHSCVSEVAKLAHHAGVKQVHLFHHDPSHDDEKVDLKLEAMKAALETLGSSTVAVAPGEGDVFEI
ncbi:MAG: response regulator [Deltaproteobacteria bacterium]|nr:response regulator [Deltaproteobacteria bacterium]